MYKNETIGICDERKIDMTIETTRRPNLNKLYIVIPMM